jgi:hypothetical protein
MTALYFVETVHFRSQCATLDEAHRLAWKLLQEGEPFVDIIQRKLTGNCWGPATGEDGLLHHLAPGEYPIAPVSGHGSTATFPPYIWRMLTQEPPAPPLAVEPPALADPVVIEEVQGALW